MSTGKFHVEGNPVMGRMQTLPYLYLLLSRDGTTDVTRTWHFGAPSKWQRVSI